MQAFSQIACLLISILKTSLIRLTKILLLINIDKILKFATCNVEKTIKNTSLCKNLIIRKMGYLIVNGRITFI